MEVGVIDTGRVGPTGYQRRAARWPRRSRSTTLVSLLAVPMFWGCAPTGPPASSAGAAHPGEPRSASAPHRVRDDTDHWREFVERRSTPGEAISSLARALDSEDPTTCRLALAALAFANIENHPAGAAIYARARRLAALNQAELRDPALSVLRATEPALDARYLRLELSERDGSISDPGALPVTVRLRNLGPGYVTVLRPVLGPAGAARIVRYGLSCWRDDGTPLQVASPTVQGNLRPIQPSDFVTLLPGDAFELSDAERRALPRLAEPGVRGTVVVQAAYSFDPERTDVSFEHPLVYPRSGEGALAAVRARLRELPGAQLLSNRVVLMVVAPR